VFTCARRQWTGQSHQDRAAAERSAFGCPASVARPGMLRAACRYIKNHGRTSEGARTATATTISTRDVILRSDALEASDRTGSKLGAR